MTIKQDITEDQALELLKGKLVVDKESGCWIFQGSTETQGYGHLRITRFRGEYRKKYRTHRLAYELMVGEIPDGDLVCHTCDVRNCCNPGHLFLGTHQDNMDDMVAKARSSTARQFGNKSRSKKVEADGVIYDSYTKAGNALGISDNGVRKRIVLGWKGYAKI